MARQKQHSRATFQNFIETESQYKEPTGSELEYLTQFHSNSIRNCDKTLKTLMEKPHTYDEVKALVKFKKNAGSNPNNPKSFIEMHRNFVIEDLFSTSLEKHAPLLRLNGLLYMARVEEDYGLLSYFLKQLMQWDWPSSAYLTKHHFLTSWVDNKTLKKYYEGLDVSGMPKGIDQIMFELWLEYKYENYGLPKKDQRGEYFGVEKYQEQWKNNNAREKIFTLVEAKSVRMVNEEYIRGSADEMKRKMIGAMPKALPDLIKYVAQDLKKRAKQAKLNDWQLKIFQLLLMTTNQILKADKNNLYVFWGSTESFTNYNVEPNTIRGQSVINRHARWLYGRKTIGLGNTQSKINAHSKYVEFYRISQQLGNLWSFNEYVYLNMFHKLTYDEKKQTFYEAK